jgi:hypothetical protein
MREIHITAGLIAIVAALIALLATKGSPLHRRAGTAFTVAMLVMASSAVVMAGLLRPNLGNLIGGLSTIYFVSTAWLTVKRPVADSRALLTGLMTLAAVLGVFALLVGIDGRTGRVDRVPAGALFGFSFLLLLAAALDLSMLIRGRIEGAARLTRHLWRMGFATFIATGSFFLGQMKFFPAPIRASGLPFVPVVFVIGMTGYWLVRTLRRRSRAPAASATLARLRSDRAAA